MQRLGAALGATLALALSVRAEDVVPAAPAPAAAAPEGPAATQPGPSPIQAEPAAAPGTPVFRVTTWKTDRPRRGDKGTFTLSDGRTVEGELLTTSDFGDVIRLSSGQRLFLPGHSVRSAQVERRALELPPPNAGLAPGEVRVFLRDGGTVQGRLVARDDDAVRVEVAAGELLAIGPGRVDAAWTSAGRLPRLRGGLDPARTRALWSPTAFLLEPKEIAFGAEMLSLSLSAGVPFVTISAATTLPVAYADTFGANATLALKAGLDALSWLHLAGGAQAYLSSKGNLASLFAAVTVGADDRYLSVYAGPPPPGAELLGRFGDRIVSAAGAWRVLPRLALLAEGWVGADGGAHEGLGGAGLRFVSRRLAIDGGALYAPASGFVPFVSVAFTVYAP
jgi:hypothetical protein